MPQHLTETCTYIVSHTNMHKQKFNNLSINTFAGSRTPVHARTKTDSWVNAH